MDKKSILMIPWNGLVKLQEVMLIITSVLVALSLNVMVFLRYVLKADLYGIEEIIVLIVMWLYFIGGSYGSYKKSHIKAGLVAMFVKNGKALLWIELVQSLFTAFLFVVISIYSIQFLSWDFVVQSKTPLHQIPYAVGHAAVTVGFILMAFYALVYLIIDIRKIVFDHKAAKV